MWLWGEAPEGDYVSFVSETLIFDAPVFNKISILMIHKLPFNVAQRASDDSRIPSDCLYGHRTAQWFSF